MARKSVELIKNKAEIVKDKIKNPDDIRKAIELVAKELDITLTEDPD